MLIQRYILIFLGLFCLNAKAQTVQCSIKMSEWKGCVPQPVKFTATTTDTGIITSYLWDFDDGSTSTQKDPNHVFTARGSYEPTVLITFADGRVCYKRVDSALVIFGNPVANYSGAQTSEIILCTRSEPYCFKDLSVPGLDGAPIVDWLWSFPDGSISFQKEPCFYFRDSGFFTVNLKVTDANGCQNIITRNLRVNIAGDIGIELKPKFYSQMVYDCKANVATLTYTNQTDTTGLRITRFMWDFGDGTGDTCYLTDPNCWQRWLKQERKYSETGFYVPKLTVENDYGCIGSYQIDTGVLVHPYDFKVRVYPNTDVCYTKDSILFFDAPSHPFASYYMWDFGDPLQPGVGRTNSMENRYKAPGTYQVRFRTKIVDCEYDTCFTVRVYGPVANIIKGGKGYTDPWEEVPAGGSFLIQQKDYPKYFDTSCYAPAQKIYYTYEYDTIVNGQQILDYCQGDTVGTIYDTIFDCKLAPVLLPKPNVKPKVIGTKDTVLITATQHLWHYSQPMPDSPVFSAPPVFYDPLIMDDTMLFSANCSAPLKVDFTNFSIKHRQHKAIDDVPPSSPAGTCFNPSYPYASDSLSYYWNFGQGTSNTSTTANPDVDARFSTEKVPSHLFNENGCYWVKLIVTDPVTGCEDMDSVPVVLQQADAGWGPEYSNIKNMTWVKQQQLPQNSPRRGLVLTGLPCRNAKQFIDLRETLPSCFKPKFFIVTDSAASITDACDPDNLQYKWQTKAEIAGAGYNTLYKDTGWKSVGLVIQNNNFCIDTVWYHNYKYIHANTASVSSDKRHYCVGDTAKIKINFPDQPGIKYFTLKYFVEGEQFDTIAVLKPDTANYIVVTRNGKADTITTTSNNPDYGIDDGNLDFNGLTEIISKQMNVAGHVTVVAKIISRFGCEDSTKTFFNVGHHQDFIVPARRVCIGDTVDFISFVRYYLPFNWDATGLDLKDYWLNPDSVRGGRKPAIAEEMFWDLNGNDTIDYIGIDPKFVYDKPGSYTIKLTTKDSLGCSYTLERKDYIQVYDIHAKFAVDTPVRYCAPHFFTFFDSSFAVNPSTGDSNFNFIYSWTWDFGDGSMPLTLTDPSKRNATHLYHQNGDYTVTLTVSTSPGTGSNFEGCKSVYTQKIQVIGPRPEFKVEGPLEGCVPFTLMIIDSSKNAKVREWKLGDGTIQSSDGEDTVYLTYTKPGIYCPELIVADTIRDLQGNILYCPGIYPDPPCKYKVVVHDVNRYNLTASDTLLCVNVTEGNFYPTIDTGYTSWHIDYGNGYTESKAKPPFKYIYPQTGNFKVKLTGQGGRCPVTDSINVEVIDVSVGFYVDMNKLDTPTFTFINTSADAVRYKWDFGDGSQPLFTDKKEPVSYTYKTLGIKEICLTAFNEKDCDETTCQTIEIIKHLFIPNVFTPGNADGKNDGFGVDIRSETFYDLQIYNRWGEQVFRSNSKYNSWNGNKKDTQTPHPEGTYYYIFNYEFLGGERGTYQGTVTLIR